MRLFKKYYKEAFDDIKPDRELISKIFEEAEKKAKPKTAVIYKYGMVFAAVMVFVVSIYAYPKILDYSRIENKSVQSAQTGHEKKDVIPDMIAENQPQDYAVSVQTENSKKAAETGDKEVHRAVKKTVQEEISTTADNIAVAANAQMSVSQDVSENEESSNKIRRNADFENAEMVVWGMEDYFSYLGLDVISSLHLPSDLKNTTGNIAYIVMKDDNIENDLMTFTFLAEGRKVLIETTKLADDSYFEGMTEAAEKINSITVYFGDNNDYENEVRLKNKDVYFTIYSKGLNKTELCDLLESVTKP